MKKTILTFLAFCLATIAWGQDPFCCTKEGAELKYVTTDTKGRETSTSITKIEKFQGSNGSYQVTQTVSSYQKGELVMKPVTVETTISNGDVSMALGGGAAITIDSNVPVIPANMAVGLDLGTGNMKVNAMGIIVNQEITKNVVVAREEITVPAGTFDCFVVEMNITAKIGPIKVQSIQKSWYSRGMGIVKSEVYDKRGKLSSIQQLESVN